MSVTAITRREWFQRAGFGAVGLALASSSGLGLQDSELFAEEPRVTVSPFNKLSDADEIALGRRFAEELDKEQAVVSNPRIEGYLNKLVGDLAARSQRPNLPYSIKLVNSAVPNAFSIPGGFLYIHRGLIEMIGSEDELAATLAHEIGHVVGRHVVNRLMLTFTARSLLRPVLNNLNKNNGVIEGILREFGGALAMMAMLHFSRVDEAQADLLGFYEMLRAGWDPNGFLKLFDQFHALEKAGHGEPIRFLSDHPPTPERAAAIRRELTQVTVPSNAIKDSAAFQFAKQETARLPKPPKANRSSNQPQHPGQE